jgi:hypothetical protein
VRKLSRREKGLLGLVALAAVAVTARALRHSDAAPAVLGRPRAERPLPAVPRIDLARIDASRGEDSAGRRDLFAFGKAAEPEEDRTPPPVVAKPLGSTGEGGAPGMPGDAVATLPVTPSLPPLNLKYIGSVENKAGVKVAVLLTDRKEVLTGQAGQVVANRYRIARIGLESVDLEDVGSGQSRRIPLKGN